jgi:hypothetical protein
MIPNRLPATLFRAVVVCAALCGRGFAFDAPVIAAGLTPQPQQVTPGEGYFALGGGLHVVGLPVGPEHEACRNVLTRALEDSGAAIRGESAEGNSFAVGQRGALPDLPKQGYAREAYVLGVTPSGVTAQGASPAGLLYAAQTLRQLVRLSSADGRLPCLTIVDYPDFRTRGVYIEGGQERFGRIVAKDYLLEQIRRLAEFKMNTLVLECYNLLPFASFPACADNGTLSNEDCREIVAESKRFHLTMIPSLQTLAQAHELVWTSQEGTPYREITAPGMMCPSNPGIYPLIKGFYRDLLTWFSDSPVMGIGCSEIDMQWQSRYCPACRRRVDAGETVRDLLLAHAVQCIAAVHEVSVDLGRPVRPLMWGDEFYMYGPGKDWVGIERIPKDTVMGYWKYWPDYSGIGGLLERGYDVLGISAMYNHSFYLADLSPEDPPKLWPPMEQTGTRNITAMLREAREAAPGAQGTFWGVATASFSKHRLRAFDSIWYGFALNGHAGWSSAGDPSADYQEAFTRAFARHYYDARTDEAANELAHVYMRLDRCKSQLELANQTLGDVVGVYDTQEPGYQGNTLMGAFRRCGKIMASGGKPNGALSGIREAALSVMKEAEELAMLADRHRPSIRRTRELADLQLATEKIAAHAERETLMIDGQTALIQSERQPPELVRKQTADVAARWAAHLQRTENIARQSSQLASLGDPLGLKSLLGDIAAIEAHFRTVAESGGLAAKRGERSVLLDERFETLDAARWITLGDPRVLDGHLETRAPGGWEKYCGVATRQALALEEDHPVVVELELNPIAMGVDSQLICSATDTGEIAYRFSFNGSTNHFNVYTQSTRKIEDKWTSPEPGWKQRASSPLIGLNTTYRLRAEIRRRAWRVTVWERGQSPLQPPLWDTGAVPMDELERTRLIFADVEPENSVGASRWGPITIWQQRP